MAPTPTSSVSGTPLHGESTFDLRCAAVHPVSCDTHWRSSSPHSLVSLARAHGAAAHGFTPSWYDPVRMDRMEAAIAIAHDPARM
jgi:hypothetical protein